MATKKNAPAEEIVSEENTVTAPVEEGPKMVKIKIPRTRKDQEDVFVSVNLNTYLIKRGVEVEVPAAVAEVIRHQEEMLETIMNFDWEHSK